MTSEKIKIKATLIGTIVATAFIQFFYNIPIKELWGIFAIIAGVSYLGMTVGGAK